jgi:hypothetical protein
MAITRGSGASGNGSEKVHRIAAILMTMLMMMASDRGGGRGFPVTMVMMANASRAGLVPRFLKSLLASDTEARLRSVDGGVRRPRCLDEFRTAWFLALRTGQAKTAETRLTFETGEKAAGCAGSWCRRTARFDATAPMHAIVASGAYGSSILRPVRAGRPTLFRDGPGHRGEAWLGKGGAMTLEPGFEGVVTVLARSLGTRSGRRRAHAMCFTETEAAGISRNLINTSIASCMSTVAVQLGIYRRNIVRRRCW